LPYAMTVRQQAKLTLPDETTTTLDS
jgi:hypothetical protein